MRYVMVAAFVGLSSTVLAQTVPPVPVSKPPPIDFGLPVKDGRGVPFVQCGVITATCPEATWLLRDVIYVELSTLVPKDPRTGSTSATPEDAKNVALAFKIYGATDPLDLSTHERDAIRISLMRGINSPRLPYALDYAACVMIDTTEACETGK